MKKMKNLLKFTSVLSIIMFVIFNIISCIDFFKFVAETSEIVATIFTPILVISLIVYYIAIGYGINMIFGKRTNPSPTDVSKKENITNNIIGFLGYISVIGWSLYSVYYLYNIWNDVSIFNHIIYSIIVLNMIILIVLGIIKTNDKDIEYFFKEEN